MPAITSVHANTVDTLLGNKQIDIEIIAVVATTSVTPSKNLSQKSKLYCSLDLLCSNDFKRFHLLMISKRF